MFRVGSGHTRDSKILFPPVLFLSCTEGNVPPGRAGSLSDTRRRDRRSRPSTLGNGQLDVCSCSLILSTSNLANNTDLRLKEGSQQTRQRKEFVSGLN